MPNNTGLQAALCGVQGFEFSLMVARILVNSVTVLLASLMLFFICSTPALHNNTFNVLFLSSYVVDILANVSRIALKYLPVLFCEHAFVQGLLSYGSSLATIINASEWYLSYTTICVGFFFNLDHMLLVVFPKHYDMISNDRTKAVIVTLTWLLPLVWIIPMARPCCRSKFFDSTMNPIFEDKQVEDLYDTLDMLLESFFYVPIVFIFNFISTTVLTYRYRKCHPAGLQTLVDQVTLQVPEPTRIGQFRSAAKRSVMRHRRVIDELDLSLLNLIDQMVDAVGVVFYMLFWAGNNNWINVNVELCIVLYDITWEISTLNQPYLFLLMFPNIRRRFVAFYLMKRQNHLPERQSSINSSVHLS